MKGGLIFYTCTKNTTWVKIKVGAFFGFEVSSQWKLLHWGTCRYLMKWIQLVYFKLKEIWRLFAPAKSKKTRSFFYFPSAKPFNESKSQCKFGLEVSSQWELLHWGTGRYLMNWIQVFYFKLKETSRPNFDWDLLSFKERVLFFLALAKENRGLFHISPAKNLTPATPCIEWAAK